MLNVVCWNWIGFSILEAILNHGYTSLNKITQGRTNDYQKARSWITIFNAIG
jgi:hypothetical protein